MTIAITWMLKREMMVQARVVLIRMRMMFSVMMITNMMRMMFVSTPRMIRTYVITFYLV